MSTRAATLMDLLALTDDELCTVLDTDALTLVSGQFEHASELEILLDLLAEPERTRGAVALRRWVRTVGPSGRSPVEMLLDRDFIAFEDALSDLMDGGGQPEGGSDRPEFEGESHV